MKTAKTNKIGEKIKSKASATNLRASVQSIRYTTLDSSNIQILLTFNLTYRIGLEIMKFRFETQDFGQSWGVYWKTYFFVVRTHSVPFFYTKVQTFP